MIRSLVFGAAFIGLGAMTTPSVQANEKSAGEFVLLMQKGEFGKAMDRCDVNMKKALTTDKLKAIWQAQTQKLGSFRKVVGERSQKHGGYNIVFVTCQFEKKNLDVKVVLDNASRVAGLFFVPVAVEYKAPEYVNRRKFKEIEVTVGKGKWALPGTLSVPRKKGPHPAVVLVHGSGPQDRDESIGPNKPFRDIALGLSSKGIAVLRYEKRTRHHGAKMAKTDEDFTVQEETIDDAVAAVDLLRKDKNVDPTRIFVLGHSLGGMLAPRIAQQKPGAAGYILLAAASRPLEDLILEQTLYQASLQAEQKPAVKARIKEIRKGVAAIKELNKENATGKLLGIPAGYWLDLKGYDPVETAKTIKEPMLVLQGEKDCQVIADRDFKRFRVLSKKKTVTLKAYPDLNHLFMEVKGKSTGAEYIERNSVDAAVVKDIADWVLKQK